MRIGSIGRGLLLGLGLAAAAACGGMESAMSDTAGRVEVEADLYSGRPNPTWTLSADEAGRLEGLLGRLAPAAGGGYPDRLGYRGLRLTLARPGAAVATAEIADGRLHYGDRAGTRVLADPGREVERWLIATSKDKVGADAYNAVKAAAERIWNQETKP
jgi:hypothetical protein